MPKAQPEGAAASGGAVQRAAMRPALGLEELLELLVQHRLLEESQAREVASRATTLRSSVLKERVGSVRSQAAARYDVSPAELVAAAHFPEPRPEAGQDRRELDREGARRRGGRSLPEDRPARGRQRSGREDALAPVRAPPRGDPDRARARRDRAGGHRPVRHRAARLARTADPGAAALRGVGEVRHPRDHRPRLRLPLRR